MTSQTLISQASTQGSVPELTSNHNTASGDARICESAKTHYRSNHQAEFFDLKAKVESLLEDLQRLSAKQPD